MSSLRYLEYAVAALLVLVCVLSMRAIAVYAAVYSLIKGPKRQLPAHVWTIATSYLILTALTLYLLLDITGDHRYAVLFAGGFAATFGLWALTNVLKYENRKYTEVSNFTDPSDKHIHNFGNPAKTPRASDERGR